MILTIANIPTNREIKKLHIDRDISKERSTIVLTIPDKKSRSNEISKKSFLKELNTLILISDLKRTIRK